MFEKVENEQIMKVEEINTKRQTAVIKTYHDQEYHIKMSVNKNVIQSDGIDQSTITAEVYNYLKEAQTGWTGDIIFEVDGIQELITTTNGVASTTFDSEVSGEFTIKTSIPNFRNSEAKVVAE